jgi:hypothetical protein
MGQEDGRECLHERRVEVERSVKEWRQYLRVTLQCRLSPLASDYGDMMGHITSRKQTRRASAQMLPEVPSI